MFVERPKAAMSCFCAAGIQCDAAAATCHVSRLWIRKLSRSRWAFNQVAWGDPIARSVICIGGCRAFVSLENLDMLMRVIGWDLGPSPSNGYGFWAGEFVGRPPMSAKDSGRGSSAPLWQCVAFSQDHHASRLANRRRVQTTESGRPTSIAAISS